MKIQKTTNSLKFLISFILFFLMIAISLDGSAQSVNKEESHQYPKMMIIPYQTSNYQSDVNLSGRKFSRRPRGFFNINANEHLSKNLNHALFENLLTYFDINRIYYYKKPKYKDDLSLIYKSISYKTHKERIKAYYKNYENFNIFQILSFGKYRWGVNCMTQETGRPIKKYKKLSYTDVVINDKDLIPLLDKKYHCNYYLFINEVELKTRFNICKDLLKNVNQKDIILHFTLINQYGNRVSGGLVGVAYKPNKGRNSIIEIVDKNMKVLSNLVVDVIKDELSIGLSYYPE